MAEPKAGRGHSWPSLAGSMRDPFLLRVRPNVEGVTGQLPVALLLIEIGHAEMPAAVVDSTKV